MNSTCMIYTSIHLTILLVFLQLTTLVLLSNKAKVDAFSNNCSLFFCSSNSRGTSAYVQSIVALSQFDKSLSKVSDASTIVCISSITLLAELLVVDFATATSGDVATLLLMIIGAMMMDGSFLSIVRLLLISLFSMYREFWIEKQSIIHGSMNRNCRKGDILMIIGMFIVSCVIL